MDLSKRQNKSLDNLMMKRDYINWIISDHLVVLKY